MKNAVAMTIIGNTEKVYSASLGLIATMMHDDSDQEETVRDDVHDALGEQFLEHRDVIHDARHRHARLVPVVVAQRKEVDLLEELAADAVQHVLRHERHRVGLVCLRSPGDEDRQRIQRGDRGQAGKIALGNEVVVDARSSGATDR